MQRIQQMGTNVMMVMSGQSRTGPVMGGFGSTQSMKLEDAEAIPAKCPSVQAAVPEVSRGQQVKYKNQNTNTQIVGTTPDYPSVRNFTVAQGRFFNSREVGGSQKVAVMCESTAENIFGTASPVGKFIAINGSRFKVVGLMAYKGGFGNPDDQILVPVSTAMRRLFGVTNIRSIDVQAKSLELMDQASSEITTLLRKRHKLTDSEQDDFRIMSQAEIIQMANANNQTFTLLLAGIASVSLLVGGIGIMNIMLVSVTERTREIGIRKALGARRHDILLQFLIESLVLSLFGGLAGILFGIVGSIVVGKMTDWNVTVSLQSIILSFTFAALVGVFFGLYPARQASNLHPIDALRYE